MKFKFSILISVLFFFFAGCSFMPDELKTAEKQIETAPDSALHILQNLPPEKYKSGESRALYGLLMIRTLDKKLLPLKPDSLLDYSISYYEQNPDRDRLASCYLYKGRSYKYKNLYEKAIENYLKALDEIQHHENYILIGRINSDMGDIYNIQGDFVVARQKYKIAYTCFSKAKSRVFAFYSLLNIGRTYHDAKENKIAEIYYRKIVPQAIDSMQHGALYQEMGLNFYDSQKYDSALYYYKKIIHYPYIEYNKATRYSLLASLYFDLKQIDSAYYYASNALKYNPRVRTQRECYRILSNCEFKKGNIQNVTVFMNKYVALGDSLRKIDSQIKGSYIETLHSTKKEAAISKSIIGFLSLIVLLILGSAYIIYDLVTSRSKKEKIHIQESHTVEKAGIRKDVATKYREVLLQKIEEQKAKHADERMKADHKERLQLDRKIYDELLHLNHPDLFFREMDSVLNNLATRLKTRYPSLTVKEICWCCLSLLDIPTTDIYVLLDYTIDGLKSMRKRLAIKTGQSGVSELNNFLEKLLAE